MATKHEYIKLNDSAGSFFDYGTKLKLIGGSTVKPTEEQWSPKLFNAVKLGAVVASTEKEYNAWQDTLKRGVLNSEQKELEKEALRPEATSTPKAGKKERQVNHQLLAAECKQAIEDATSIEEADAALGDNTYKSCITAHQLKVLELIGVVKDAAALEALVLDHENRQWVLDAYNGKLASFDATTAGGKAADNTPASADNGKAPAK